MKNRLYFRVNTIGNTVSATGQPADSIHQFILRWLDARGIGGAEVLSSSEMGAGSIDWLSAILNFFYQHEFLKNLLPLLRIFRPIWNLMRKRQDYKREIKYRLVCPSASLFIIFEINKTTEWEEKTPISHLLFISRALLNDLTQKYAFLNWSMHMHSATSDNKYRYQIVAQADWLSMNKHVLLLHEITQKMNFSNEEETSIIVNQAGIILLKKSEKYYVRLLGMFIRIPTRVYFKLN